jgi:predicted anti-sigma-YlaC factor YlaD
MLASGDSVYERDDDLILVGDALPFSLKLVESLLSQSPQHYGLLLTASRGFVLYSYAYVHFDADQLATDDLDRALELRHRGRRLYLRAFDYALRALEIMYPGFAVRLGKDPQQAVREVSPEDSARAVPLLYWGAAALGLAISVSRHNAALLARLPEVDALLARALELDEGWNAGTLHEFQVTLAAAGRLRADDEAIRRHYQRALQLSQGRRASLYVAYAEAASIPNQNRAEFRELLDKALTIDIDEEPEHRLINALAQRRAKWLQGRIDELFL